MVSVIGKAFRYILNTNTIWGLMILVSLAAAILQRRFLMSDRTITAVPGVAVGHHTDEEAATGVTVLTFPEPNTAVVDVRGGAPGTRETDALGPAIKPVTVNALMFAGGSAFGLAAAAGVSDEIELEGRQRVAIHPGREGQNAGNSRHGRPLVLSCQDEPAASGETFLEQRARIVELEELQSDEPVNHQVHHDRGLVRRESPE